MFPRAHRTRSFGPLCPSVCWAPSSERTVAESALDCEAIGDLPSEVGVMFCPVIGDLRYGRLGKWTRSSGRTFGATRIVAGGPGCRE